MLYFSKNNKNAFTLVELMVIIVLIIIIILWIKSINFNKLSNEQKSEIFANRIISIIETFRDEDLTWKTINWSRYTKRLLLKKNNQSYYVIDDNIFDLKKENKEEIISLKCNWENSELDEIDFFYSIVAEKGFNITPHECNKANIKVWYNNSIYEIEYDLISWLVKKCKNSCN